MRFALVVIFFTLQSTVFAQVPKSPPPYAEDVAGMYGELQQVTVWEVVCTEQFPATTDANRRAVENWRDQYSSFVQEIELRYRAMLWSESKQDPARHKALLEYFARTNDTAKRDFKAALIRRGLDTFQKQCENYSRYLKSPRMNLEVSLSDVVSRIRKVPASFNYSGEVDDQSIQILQRALHAMNVAAGVKSGFTQVKRTEGRTTPFIEAVLVAPDKEIEQVYAQVLLPRISREDAKFLLDFYTSPTGVQLIADQSVEPANPNPTLHLNSAQLREARAFSGSAAMQRYKQITESPAFLDEVGNKLKASLLR